MTDGEYERLSTVVESEGMTLGEWCRGGAAEARGRSQTEGIEETLPARCWHYGQSC